MVAVGNSNSNDALAALLAEIATLLRDDGASEYRVVAYERASRTLSELTDSVEQIYRDQGLAGLIAIPTIGRSIAGLIEHYFRSHQVPLLERLRGEDSVEHQIASLRSVGPELARRIHDALHISTLPQLLAAAIDGRLSSVPGIGEKRVQAIRESLLNRVPNQNRISHVVQLQLWDELSDQRVSVSELLDVDAEFRRVMELCQADTESSPPVLIQRGKRQYNVHYSDSPRAQQLHATKDWVVITRVGQTDPQMWTVITIHSGRLNGCRSVRGREDECYQHYREEAKKAVESYPMVWR